MNAHASDIILNHDWSHCKDSDGEWMMEEMKVEAILLAGNLQGLGVDCTADEVLEELFDRI